MDSLEGSVIGTTTTTDEMVCTIQEKTIAIGWWREIENFWVDVKKSSIIDGG